MKVHLKALGCRLNEAELEQWSQDFMKQGHSIVTNTEDADWVVLNTCAVTQDAGRKSRKLMNRLYRENPAAKLIVSGCHATLQEDEVAKTLGVDLVVGNQEKDQLPARVMQQFAVNNMPEIATEPGETSLFSRGRQRAFIKIQDGCRYRCTFCIVTVARGDERSRTPADIVEEINRLHTQGIQEIVLTGVHVGGYGSDLNISLYELVNSILQETDIPRIRFASVEPWDLPDDFFSLFENKRIMPHMHLPIQSGADSVLRRMSRRCKTSEFTDLVNLARQKIPGFNVTTDIIVGFPGETQEEWEQTLSYVEETGFGHIHIFSYSPREGTKAARLSDPVPNDIKKQRSQELHQLADQLKADFLQKHIGMSVPVLWERGRLVDENQPLGDKVFTGYTPNFCKLETQVSGTILLENKIRDVSISALLQDDLLLTGSLLE
jgi:threonylcarbamoyladenosine tRNA methylthiotransferase MtaB